MKRIQRLVLLFCLSAASPGFGFVIMRSGGSEDNKLKWLASAVGDIHYSFYNNTRPTGFDVSVQNAATDWQNETRSEIGFTKDEDKIPSSPIGDDGDNIVYYGSIDPNDYGHSFVWYNASTGEIHGFDINIEPTTPLYPWHYDPIAYPAANEVDCLTYMRRWFGNALGVGNLRIAGRAGDMNKVMYQPPRPGCRYGLHRDDKNAAEFQYPGSQYVNDRIWIRDGEPDWPEDDDDGSEPYPHASSCHSPDIHLVNPPPEIGKLMQFDITCRNVTDTVQSCSCRFLICPPYGSGIPTPYGLFPAAIEETKPCQIPPGNFDGDHDGAILDPNDYTNPAGDGQAVCTFNWSLPMVLHQWVWFCAVASVFQVPAMGPDAEPVLTTICSASNNLAQTNFKYDSIPIARDTGMHEVVDSFWSPNFTGEHVARYLTARFMDSTGGTARIDPPTVLGETVLAGDVDDVFRLTIRVGPNAQPGDSHFVVVRCVMLSLASGDTLDKGGLGILYRCVTPPTPGWTQRANLPAGAKPIKDGGWLAYDAGTGLVYASRGNKQLDFFSYNPPKDSWRALAPWLPGTEGKPPSKGSAGCSDRNGTIYATKGNNRPGFYKYEAATNTWTQKKDVPLGVSNKKVKGGTGIVWAYKDGVGSPYLLKGYMNEFYRYDVASDSWKTLTPAPIGANQKWDKGSWLAYDDVNNKIYAHKAKYQEFYSYNTETDSWSGPLTGMPTTGSGGNKKAKDGSCGSLTRDDCWKASIYALKGGGTQEFWQYTIVTNSWAEKETLPRGALKKKVKTGAGIAAVGMNLYALKGNKTNEFWKYTPAPGPLLYEAPRHDGVVAGKTVIAQGMSIRPNPLTGGFATVRYSLPKAGFAALRIYDVAGRRVLSQTMVAGRTGTTDLDLRKLSAGVYLVKVTTEGFSTTQKLVVQH